MAQGQIELTAWRRAPTTRATRGRPSTSPRPAAAGPRTRAATGSRCGSAAGPTYTLPVESLPSSSRRCGPSTVLPRDPAPLPAVVDQAFLDRTGAAVGDTLHASVFGVPVALDLIARADAFPPLDQTKPFVLVDTLSLDLARAGAGGSIVPADEWWLATDPGQAQAVAAALRSTPISADDVVERSAVTADLAGDPLGLGVIGILGLGSLAALVFASIGFLVSATVSISERIGEFALLKALGLSPRQLPPVAVDREPDAAGDGPDPRHAARPPARVPRAAVRHADAHRRTAGPDAGDRRPAGGGRADDRARRRAGPRDGRAGGPPAAGGADELGAQGEGRVAMRWTWVALKRIGDDLGATIGFAVLVLVTALLAALAPRVLASLADEAVRAQVRSAPVVARSIVLLENRTFGPGPDDDPLAQVRDAGRRAVRDLPDVDPGPRGPPRHPGRERPLPRPEGDHRSRLRPAADPGGHRRSHPVRRRAARRPSVLTTRNNVGPESADNVPVYEAAISTDTAEAFGIELGETVPLVGDPGDQLIGRTRHRPAGVRDDHRDLRAPRIRAPTSGSTTRS